MKTEIPDEDDDLLTAEDFSLAVHYMIRDNPSLSCFDAVLLMAERVGFDPEFQAEEIANLISENLKGQMEVEANQARILKGAEPELQLV